MRKLNQAQKVKLYHILKVVFYMLGLPLFFVAVFFTAMKFIGVEPFVGASTTSFDSGVFVGYERFITSPALYGIWCAFAIWAAISICHIAMAKTVKNGKIRMISMLAIILVVMFGTMGIMDGVYTSQINKLIKDAPEGVTVQDYNSQLSYYDYVSYGRHEKSLIYELTSRVAQYEEAYNIEWQGINKSGDAGNFANKPVTYADIIADDGTIGAGDMSDRLVEVAPTGGKLVIDGKTYSNYYYVNRKGATGVEVNVWYSTQLIPVGYTWKANKGSMSFNLTDGVYGEGLYNPNGMLSDGWVFSFENMLEILEDYYAGQEFLATADKDSIAALQEAARELRDNYYSGAEALPSTEQEADPYLQSLYSQEIDFAGKYSMPRERVEEVVSYVGALLGDNALFDWLLTGDQVKGLLSIVGGFLEDKAASDLVSNLIDRLKDGASLTTLLGAFGQAELGAQIVSYINTIFGGEGKEYKDIYIKLEYKTESKDHLYLAIYGDNGSGAIDTSAVIADVDFDEGMLNAEEYNFDLDRLSVFLNKVLNKLVDELGIKGLLDTVGGLVFTDMTVDGKEYKGIEISGIALPLLNADGQFDIDVVSILTHLLEGFYSYQSPAIKPVWEFYNEVAIRDAEYVDDPVEYTAMAKSLADYERAYYEATVYGKIIGSTLVGDTIGAGTYPAALGLTDLASVRQLKYDLSYQPKNFPLYAFREMLLTFTGIVMFFYMLSFLAAAKERKYAAMTADANGECTEGCACGGKSEKKENAFTKWFNGTVVKAFTANDQKASKGRMISSYVLYGLAFLPLLIVALVLAAKTTAVLPAYGGLAFLGFYILLAFAAIFAVVVAMLNRKSKKAKKRLCPMAKTKRIAITFFCLTLVFGLLFTYVLPDPVAKATSNTLWAEDIYNRPMEQVAENAALEHQFVMNNLLNGNLNDYDPSTGLVKEHGDFSYVGLKTNEEVKKSINDYVDKYYSLKALNSDIANFDATRAELYNYIYQNYVLNDYDYAFKTGDSGIVDRRAVALAITDYLYAHADYAKLVHNGFKNKKVKQLFDANYDSFNQDGYKTFDDPLLLYAQMDGRMTVEVIIRLILNKGWTYTQASGEEGELYFDENNTFLYEMYDPQTYDAFVKAHGTFDHDGQLVNKDGSTYNVKYGVNEEGWKIYANKVVRRPLNWLVLDMLGDPMDLATLDVSSIKIGPVSLDTVLGMIGGTGVYNAVGGLLTEDVQALVGKLTDGAGLRVGAYMDDNGQLKLQLLPMNTTYAMLGYMQATWVQSNGLLMAVINLLALRNYFYIFGAIGLLLIAIAGGLQQLEEKYVVNAVTAEGSQPTEGAETPEAEEAPETAEAPETETTEA